MPRGVRHAILKKVFKVHNTQGMFSDAINAYYANATAANHATTGEFAQRKGQLMWGKSGTTEKIYLSKAISGTARWSDLTDLGG